MTCALLCALLAHGDAEPTLAVNLARSVMTIPADSAVSVSLVNLSAKPYTIWEGQGLTLELSRSDNPKPDFKDWNPFLPNSNSRARLSGGESTILGWFRDYDEVPYTVLPGAKLRIGRASNLASDFGLKVGRYQVRATYKRTIGNIWLESSWVSFEVLKDMGTR